MKYLKLYEQFRLLLEADEKILSPEKFIIQPYPIESDNDKNKPTLLLIPGGGGNPIKDYDVLAPLLKEKFNLITFSYDENVKENGKEKCKKIAEQLKSYPNLSILGFSMGTTFGFWIIKALGENFIAHPQYVQGTLTSADSLQFESVWLANNTYRIATSGSEKQRVAVSIFDQNNNPIFDNSDFSYAADWDFFVEQSMKIRCVVRPLAESNEVICVTALTGFKK
jgi:hypothetical protein